MTTVFERAQTALETLNVPVANQVLVMATGTQLPDLYLAHFLVTSPPLQHADNAEKLRSYQVQVNVFNRAGLTGLPDVDGAMTAAGFRVGPKYQLAYSRETRHFGLAQEYVYLEES